MLFKNIELYNFGRYGGKNFLDTSVTVDRNVILIKAINDRGKTTLFQAIKFALYGDNGLDRKTASNWINMKKASEEDGIMYVEIKFEHEQKICRLKRSIKFRKTDIGKEIETIGNSIVDVYVDDKPIMIEDSDLNKKDWIDTILPKDASQFFFFDGEEIKRYIQQEETQVKQAIEKVLGIKELLNAKEDLTEIYSRFQIEYNKNIKKHNKDERVQNQLEELYEEIKSADQNIEITTNILIDAQRRKQELVKDLEKHQNIKNIVEERKEIESKLNDLKKSLKVDQKNLTTNCGNLGLVLSSSLLDMINNTDEDPPSKDRWQSDVIKFIMSNHLDNCVCERPINDEVRNIFSSKTLNLIPSKKSILKKFVNGILIDHAPAAKLANLLTSLESVSNRNQDIDKQKSILENINHQIRSSEYEKSIKELQSKYEEIVKDINTFETDLDMYRSQKLQLESKKDDLEFKINSSVVDEQLKSTIKRKDMCEIVIDCMEQVINRFYEKRKPKLEEHISKVFSSLTNNPALYRGLKIDKDFSMKVLRNDGTELPTYMYSPSAGASQIVATSMIGGLNKFATKDAPIVIDTPMSRLDPNHQNNLINYYSKMGKQIIILYQPKELENNDIQSITDNLASEWEIESVPNHPDMSNITKKVSYL
ncbi:MAG: AAA domain-containing protein [Cenarchaeum symbiont of Oopsacas minuta]|nr:AAA domain-containing protein [Cenarchaeum symbiont of Oopsacas minuta]